MKIKSLPTGLFAEVLDYLADYENLSGLDLILDEEYSVLDVRNALREMALKVREEAQEEKTQQHVNVDYRKDRRLTSNVKDVLSSLSPTEEKKLLDQFGLLES